MTRLEVAGIISELDNVDMSDPKKRLEEELSRVRHLVSGSAFEDIMKPPSMPEFMKPYVPPGEAELVVDAIGEEVERWKAETPEGKHLVILLGTPDGGIMDVERFQAFGRFSYRAIGYVSGERNMVVGHVATLAFRGFYEDNATGDRHAGFKAFIQSQQTGAPQQPDNK